MKELSQEDLGSIFEFNPHRMVLPYGWCGHIPFAAWVVKQLRPRILVELGTHSGNSYFSFCQAVQEYGVDARCYAVDTWQGDDHSGKYGEKIFSEVSFHNESTYAEFSNLLRMTFDEALAYFPEKSVDLLHIDGLHTYEAVKRDFESWLPKLSSTAVVLFHDINVRERDFGVWKVWDELKKSYPSCEFHHSHGLGVLIVGSELSAHAQEAIQACNSKYVRHLFALKGQSIVLNAAREAVEEQREEMQRFQVAAEQRERDLQASAQKARADMQAEAQRQASQTESTLQALNAHCERLQRDMSALHHSWSWRITAPLRWVAAPSSGIRRFQKTLLKAIDLGGGVVPTIALTWDVMRQEGFGGVRQRLSAARALSISEVGLQGLDQAPESYTDWLARNDPTDAQTLKRLAEEIAALPLQPLISIIMPVYNPPLEYLKKAIDSVRAQIYPQWELCIADDASPNEEIRNYLRQEAAQDKRLKVIFRTENGHISAASNSALTLASGELVGLMDHDDVLAPHALAHVVRVFNRHADAEIIYSDEDKIGENGERFDPYFKCEFNQELFLAQNMICHFGVYRKATVERIGGFRVGVEGAQDWDLALRVLEVSGAKKILHIPRVLYHWRAFAGSTALNENEKPYAAQAQVRAVQDHLVRTGRSASVCMAPDTSGMLRVRFDIPKNSHKVSIIIPTRDRVDILKMCIDSIREKSTFKSYEIIIVDNSSVEVETLEYFSRIKSNVVNVISANIPFNYSRLNNIGVQYATGDILCLMNNDIEILTPDWIEEMMSFAIQPEIGCVGARLWYPDGGLQHGGCILGIGGVAGHAFKSLSRLEYGYFSREKAHQNYSAVTAACLMVKKAVYESVGGLDETLEVAFNDIDFCLRVRASGLRNVWTPYAEMNHHESASRGLEDNPEKISRFAKEVKQMLDRWHDLLLVDPAYSPNLTLETEDFARAKLARLH